MKYTIFCLFALLVISTSVAQTSIKGLITNGDEALPWVNVHVKNSTIGVTTDGFGRFALEIQKGDILVISHIGYETQEILIENQQKIFVALEWNVLDEVIIVAQNIKRCTRTINCGITCCSIKGGRIEYTKPKEEIIAPSTILYPNPSSNGNFYIQLSDDYQNVQIFVNAMNGQQILKKNVTFTSNIPLDLSHYPTGIYLINIIADGERLPAQKAIRG